MHCAFCIVPSTRGSERSRPIAEIVSEVRKLVSEGIREVTLLGQIVNLYGRHEFPRTENGLSPFVQLLEAVHAVDGLDRLRFTSPHPIGFKSDLVDAFSRLPKLMPHVHLPMQSGSDRILKLMRRAYTVEKYVGLTEQLKAARPGIALTTDVIVGFPGETEDEYRETRNLVQHIGFDNAFIFRYSPRKDTPAAEMLDQLPDSVKEERNQDLLRVIDGLARAKGEAMVGTRVEVLCEGTSKTNEARLSGRSPDNKIVIFEGGERLIGQILPIQIERAMGFSVYGTPAIYV